VNIIGNGVATIVIAKWEGGFDDRRAAHILNGELANPERTELPGSAREDR
jgi:aerobic C4-dicarboxylate transport protein